MTIVRAIMFSFLATIAGLLFAMLFVGPSRGEAIMRARDSIVSVTSYKKTEDGAERVMHGSGIMLRENGTIAICAHEAAGADYGIIEFRDGRTAMVAFAVSSDLLDVGIAHVEGMQSGFIPAQLGHSPKVGDDIFVVGNPGTLRWLVTTGIVGQVDPQKFVTDATANPGSSGGGVFDWNGRLVGMVCTVPGPYPGTFYQGHSGAVSVAVLRWLGVDR